MQEERRTDLGNYFHTADLLASDRQGPLDRLDFAYLKDSGSVSCGSSDRVIEARRRCEAAGCDMLLCRANSLKIPHEQVLHTIELMGRHVLPEFQG